MEYSGNDKSARNVELRALDDEMRELEFDSNPAKQGATAYDIRDMDALDLTPTFRRRFKFVAMVGFSSTVVVAWQNVLTTFGFAFYNGGTGGLFWTFIFSMIAMTFVYLTLSELASAFPTAGGQYQWVAECAPPSMRKLLSYCTGWLLVLGWQTWLCSCGVVIGNIIKYCALLYHPDSTHLATQWFPTLLAIITLFLGGLFNVYCTSKFPLLESIMLMIHWAAWLAIVVTLWVTSERSSASEVLFTFANPSGWPNGAVASLVGIITAWGSLLGYDSSVHMTENAKDASRTIPFSLMTAFVTNTTLALVTMITMIFCAGSFAGEFNANSTPFIQVFLHSTKSRAATVVMTVPIMLTLWSALISQVATASRQLWAFARDGGLPWSKHLAPVHNADVPRRAVWLTIIFTSALSCINFGPVVGFNAIVSLAVVAVTFSYTICTSCLLWRRFYGKPFPKERFSLGAFGPVINIVTLCCTAPVTVLSVFPSEPNPPPVYMNWACVVFGAVAIFSLTYYFVGGRKTFSPPIRKSEYLQ